MRKFDTGIAVVSLVLFAVGVAIFPAGAVANGSQHRVAISDLRHSVVPAYCYMPRQRLHHNKTARKYLPRQGSINFRQPGHPIFAHLRPGRPDLLAVYDCTAGGVGWPQVVVAYSPHGRLLDALYLGHYGHQEHGQVTHWQAAGHNVRMRWISYDGCCFDRHRHHSRITLSQGRLALQPIG
jgi:hypothetical protein